jgi:hypothetical protein
MSRIGPFLASFALLLSVPASADVIPMDAAPCSDKSAGDACTPVRGGEAGTCTPTTLNRSRLRRNADGSVTAVEVPYEYILCSPDQAKSKETPAKPTEQLPAVTPPPPVAPPPAATGTETRSDGGKGDGRSRLAEVARKAAPWAIAGSFSLLFLLARRRKAR